MGAKLYAIASNSPSVESQVSNQAARAPHYLLFDDVGNILEASVNPVSDAAGHAAPQAVEFLAGKGVSGLVAASFGHKMLSELAARGIDQFEAQGPVEAAIRTYLEGQGQ